MLKCQDKMVPCLVIRMPRLPLSHSTPQPGSGGTSTAATTTLTTTTGPRVYAPITTNSCFFEDPNMAVQQHVLNWLYSVLTSEYRDVNRAYSDVAQALAQYPSLSPRTDVHTFPNGSSALLVRLTGTIPVLFRGTTYRFPISLWVPHAYPQEAPLVYVTPTENMMVRPGQHVDPQGQVYHPYLAGWAGFWDKSSILDFLAILRDVFAKEPPVVARQPGGPPPPPAQQLQPASPPPVPPLPPDLASRPSIQAQHHSPENAPRPPPPPPKPGMQVDPRQPPVQGSPRAGPPVPPLPPKPGRPISQYAGEDPRLHHEQQARPGPSRYDTAPPLPPQAPQSPPVPPRPFHPPVQQQPPPPPPGPQYQRSPPPPSNYSPGPPQPPYLPNDTRRALPPQQQFTPLHQQQWQQPQAQPPIQQPPPPQPNPPVPDIMDSEDLTLSIPPTTTSAPPIPPNPEKDALLRQLASTLFTLRQQARDQNNSSLAGLQSQRQAMAAASQRMQAELAQLTQLSNLLTSNTSILQDSLRKADAVIESSSRLPEPNIDELLVAPTVVGNQLYDLVAEERALADAIFVLGRAVERGRIAPQTFARLTRSLAREWYLKKALVKKIGVGMGLSTGVGY
ncbi:Suppressor protein stp22 of temperature-sensitive alpha-factor receptor and arginine permease [Podospora bellae-mahoneyi]|uniref:Suppressor protein stp22 of temperature-sensitive alpha-factor receptor and arginine permease n=1 Tax=Podospora bellae-mahoneyi TaxID=2093777 RepID=A0ABR0FJ08_9PEZI|nr:Suppressor protein stp22 of temperature-sensitive alpha-factor receptor and arginine permease [Podospora bellae-mahoneyi]